MPTPIALAPSSTPDVVMSWWRVQAPPWTESIEGRPIDTARTAGLHRLLTGDSIRDRVRTNGGTPLQVSGWRNTTVVTFSKKLPTGLHQVPLPEQVWLLRNGDDQWFGVNPERGLYWELSALGPTFFSWWRADSAVRFDKAKPWNAVQGVAGGGIPIWALIPTNGQLKAGPGAIETALNFVVGGGYAQAFVPWLRKSDGGLATSHPLRAGERLRLTEQAYQRLLGEARTADDYSLLWALRYRGGVVNDKTAASSGHALRLPVGANVTIRLTILDFEVVLT